MKKLVLFKIFLITVSLSLSWKAPDTGVIGAGTQPQISVDPKGVMSVVFGRNDSIFCATSVNQGTTFSIPVLVGKVTGMHLGMSRGPQIASSATTSLITAMDKAGDIHFFQLDNNKSAWISKGYVNDLRYSAPEGLMGLAADKNDHYYAVWLDTRLEKKNNIYFSYLNPTQKGWSKNTLIYQSPDGHVCECCKPNITVKNNQVAIMFRNWISGSRDMYLLQSTNAGRNFRPAQKLGDGTWPLKACPMDGGGLVIDNKGGIQTTWQRQGVVYTCRPGEPEIKRVDGRGPAITYNPKNDKWLISYQEGESAKIISSEGEEMTTVRGSFLKAFVLNKDKVFYVWEFNKLILFKQPKLSE
ncbi:MAG: hypothetical protein V4450_13460 [Bacteroidota bacterium]